MVNLGDYAIQVSSGLDTLSMLQILAAIYQRAGIFQVEIVLVDPGLSVNYLLSSTLTYAISFVLTHIDEAEILERGTSVFDEGDISVEVGSLSLGPLGTIPLGGNSSKVGVGSGRAESGFGGVLYE